MASINLSGVLRNPDTTLAGGGEVRLIHRSNTGEVISGFRETLTINSDGTYDFNIQYGNVFIQTRDVGVNQWTDHGTLTINQDTTATTLPELLNAAVPPTEPLLLELQQLLSDAEAAAASSEQSAIRAETAAQQAENQYTTEELINSADLSSKPVGFVIETTGYRTSGDKGAGGWIKTSTTGAGSRGPDATGTKSIYDINGVRWDLVSKPITAESLGCVADFNSATLTGTNNDLFLKAFFFATRGEEGKFLGASYFVNGGGGHELTSPTKLRGVGQRFGTTIYYGGTPTTSVKTFRIHPNDGGDAPISSAIEVKSPNVDVQDIVLSNVFDIADPNDFGSPWDVGWLVSAGFFTTDRARAIGYWRKQGILFNVTLDNGNCDGCTLKDSWFQGFWGGSALGPLPESGQAEIQPGDVRGAGGMSDLVCLGSTRFLDMHHHSKRRLSDTDGGSWWVDGYLNTPAGAIQGHHYNEARFVSSSLYSVKVERSSRDNFTQSHIERLTGYFKSDGVTPANDTHIDISTEARYTSFTRSVWYNQDGNVFDGEEMSFLDNIEGGSSGQYPFYHTVPFTPTLLCDGIEIAGYNTQQGYYRIVDGILHFSIRLLASDITGSSGGVSIGGLPEKLINSSNSHAGFPIMTFNVGMGIGVGPINGLINPNSDEMDLFLTRDGSGITRLTASELLSNTFIHVNQSILVEGQ